MPIQLNEKNDSIYRVILSRAWLKSHFKKHRSNVAGCVINLNHKFDWLPRLPGTIHISRWFNTWWSPKQRFSFIITTLFVCTSNKSTNAHKIRFFVNFSIICSFFMLFNRRQICYLQWRMRQLQEKALLTRTWLSVNVLLFNFFSLPNCCLFNGRIHRTGVSLFSHEICNNSQIYYQHILTGCLIKKKMNGWTVSTGDYYDISTLLRHKLWMADFWLFFEYQRSKVKLCILFLRVKNPWEFHSCSWS